MDKSTALVLFLLMCHGIGNNGFQIYKRTRGKPFFFEDENGQLIEVRRRGFQNERSFETICDCYCLIAGDESTIHCCVNCQVTDNVCFPGAAHVTLRNGDMIKMADLKVGDEILTGSDDGAVEASEVLGFLTFDPEVIGRYYKLTVESGEAILLSRSHIVFTSHCNISLEAVARFAADISVDDYLLVRSGSQLFPRRVLSVEVEAYSGAYVPLTTHGTLLVNDVMASSYAAFPHNLAHTFLAPMRWFPSLLQYTPTGGDHPYITFLKELGKWVVPEKSRFMVTQGNSSLTLDKTLTMGQSVLS